MTYDEVEKKSIETRQILNKFVSFDEWGEIRLDDIYTCEELLLIINVSREIMGHEPI